MMLSGGFSVCAKVQEVIRDPAGTGVSFCSHLGGIRAASNTGKHHVAVGRCLAWKTVLGARLVSERPFLPRGGPAVSISVGPVGVLATDPIA